MRLDKSPESFTDFPILCFLLLMSSVKISADLNAEIKSSNLYPLSAGSCY